MAKTADDVHFIPFEDLTDNDGDVTPPAIDPRTTLALLQYTGGTTGVAKGAALTHANVDINVQQVTLWFSGFPGAAVRSLAILPFFHAFAMTCVMNWSLSSGAEMLLVPRFQPEAAAEADRQEEALGILRGADLVHRAHEHAGHRPV